MMIKPGGQSRQTDNFNTVCKAGDARHGVVELDRVSFVFAHNNSGNGQLALRKHVERSECVADRAQIPADDQYERDVESSHPVQDGAAAVERNHDAADAFDDERILVAADGIAAEGVERLEIDADA